MDIVDKDAVEPDFVIVGGCDGTCVLKRDELDSYLRGQLWAPVCATVIALAYAIFILAF